MTSSSATPETIEPVRVSTRVRRNIDDTFDLFANNLTAWWPLDRFSFDLNRSFEIHLEPFVGGRFFERYSDGDEHTIGLVLQWDPPTVLAFTWQHDDWVAATEVEVRFIAEEAFITRVELEHRSWERLGAFARENRDGYANGWPTVIGCFTTIAGAVGTD